MAIIINAIICRYQMRKAMTEWEKAQNGFLYDANYDEKSLRLENVVLIYVMNLIIVDL